MELLEFQKSSFSIFAVLKVLINLWICNTKKKNSINFKFLHLTIYGYMSKRKSFFFWHILYGVHHLIFVLLIIFRKSYFLRIGKVIKIKTRKIICKRCRQLWHIKASLCASFIYFEASARAVYLSHPVVPSFEASRYIYLFTTLILYMLLKFPC